MNTFLLLLSKGLIAGFCYSLVSVTAGLYCAHFVVKRGWLCGFVAGAGIASVQLIWAFLAMLILDYSMDHIPVNPVIISLIGAGVLYVLAWKAYQTSKEPLHTPKTVPHQKLKAFLQAFPLALAYPLRTVGFAAILALLGTHRLAPYSIWQGMGTVIGVGIGALSWWTLITLAVLGLKQRISPTFIQLTRRLTAFGIAAFATGGLIVILIRAYLNAG